MQSKSVVKIVIDILMTVWFAVLLFPLKTGVVFHEIMGLSVVGIVGLHLFLNRHWVKNVSRKLLSQRNPKTVLMFVLNTILLLNVIAIIITGLFISSVIIPNPKVHNPNIAFIHKWISYVTVGLLVVHLVLHSRYIVASVKKMVADIEMQSVKRALGGATAFLLVLGFIYYYVITGASKNYQARIYNSITAPSTHVITDADTNIDEMAEEEDVIITAETEPVIITLREFLSKQICTICAKRCPLSSPSCGKSLQLILDARAEYESLYEVDLGELNFKQ